MSGYPQKITEKQKLWHAALEQHRLRADCITYLDEHRLSNLKARFELARHQGTTLNE